MCDDLLPSEGLFALDRRWPLGEVLNALAGFRGNAFRATRWAMRGIGPLCAQAALAGWRVPLAEVVDSPRPFLFCPAEDGIRGGLRLLTTEWLECRARGGAAGWRLVLGLPAPQPTRNLFDLVHPFWEQVQALKRVLGVRHTGLYLWVGSAGFPRLLAGSQAVVLLPLTGTREPLPAAWQPGKPVIAPAGTHLAGQPIEECGYSYETRPAFLRLPEDPGAGRTVTECRLPEPLALAGALRQLTEEEEPGRKRPSPRPAACGLARHSAALRRTWASPSWKRAQVK
jgi:hypothetical protein